jgi:hypothetical protein
MMEGVGIWRIFVSLSEKWDSPANPNSNRLYLPE